MDHMAKYYKNLSENLFNQRNNLVRLLNEVAKKPEESETLVDGVWVDQNGNPVESAPTALPSKNSQTTSGPAAIQSQQPPLPAPTTPEGKYEAERTKYYTKRNQKAKDEAAENEARMGALNPSSSATTNAARAVSALRTQRAKERDKFDTDDIARMVKSDSKERFMSQADKDARKTRNAAAVAELEKAGHKKMGHTQTSKGEWIDSQGNLASLATTVDKLGPDTIIQGTNMTRGEFERQTGRKYDATNREDSTLVSQLAGAGKLGTEAARQGARSSDAMNQGYGEINTDFAKRIGQSTIDVDAAQIELDRFRNDPEYRESQRNLDSKGNPIMTPELRAQIAAQTERDVKGIKKERRAETIARVNKATGSWYTGDINKDVEEIGKAVSPTTEPGNILYGANGRLLAGLNKMDIKDVPEEEKPQTTLPPVSGGQVTNAAGNMNIGGTDYKASRKVKPTPAGVNSAVGQPQLQTRQTSPPPAAAPTSVGPPSSTTGAQNTTPATQPTATPVRPAAPAAPPVAVGSSVTAKAATMTTKPQLASAGAPIDAQQTGGPTAQNRGIPIPSANPMADAQAGPLGAPLKKKLVTTTGRTPNMRA